MSDFAATCDLHGQRFEDLDAWLDHLDLLHDEDPDTCPENEEGHVFQGRVVGDVERRDTGSCLDCGALFYDGTWHREVEA